LQARRAAEAGTQQFREIMKKGGKTSCRIWENQALDARDQKEKGEKGKKRWLRHGGGGEKREEFELRGKKRMPRGWGGGKAKSSAKGGGGRKVLTESRKGRSFWLLKGE